MADTPPTSPADPLTHAGTDTAALMQRIDQLDADLAVVRHQLAEDHRLVTLGTLSAGLAHEINNLLTPILGYASLGLQHTDDPEAVCRSLTRTRDAAERAAEVCQAVLSLARAPERDERPSEQDAGKPTPQANLREVAEQALTTTICLSSNSRHQVDNQLPDRDVAMPPVSLLQVLVNLLINAQHALDEQAGPAGQVTLWADLDADTAHIHLRDTGPGIPPEQLPTLFEAFTTGPTDQPNSHHGLGLWISKQLIENAGGTIDVDTDLGNGTTFTLSLPLVHEPRSALRRPAEGKRRSA